MFIASAPGFFKYKTASSVRLSVGKLLAQILNQIFYQKTFEANFFPLLHNACGLPFFVEPSPYRPVVLNV